jgi:hypothetical protein
MINLRFSLVNPLWDRFSSIHASWGKTPWQHKFWECQVMRSDDILVFDLRVNVRCDHAGVDLWLGLLGYSVNLQIYDNRHWDHQKGTWQDSNYN